MLFMRCSNPRVRPCCQLRTPTCCNASPDKTRPNHPSPHRRQALLVLPATCVVAAAPALADTLTAPTLDTLDAVTARVYLDIGLCPEAARQDRTLGDKSILCTQPKPLGRLVLGLYGNAAPETVRNFATLVQSGALAGTTFHKLYPGEFIKAGQQGSKRNGQVEPPEGLGGNSDVLNPAAFKLRHSRPGILSLALSENDDAAYIRERRGYRSLQFLITTGPGPQPALDGENIVFGRVEQGMDVVASIASVPAFSPSAQLRQYNQLASALGDDRAARARAAWGKPLQAVVITDAGVVAS